MFLAVPMVLMGLIGPPSVAETAAVKVRSGSSLPPESSRSLPSTPILRSARPRRVERVRSAESRVFDFLRRRGVLRIERGGQSVALERRTAAGGSSSL